MRQYVIRRAGYCLLSLFLLSVTIFFFVRVTGDPATLLVEPGASEADIAAIHQQFGLDRPLLVQYGIFLASLAHGDLGQSFYYRTPVMELYLSRLPNSLYLATVAMAFSLLIGIPSGILASVRVGRFWDRAGKMFTLLGLSLPSFWVGLVLILVFSVYLGWLPSSGAGTPLHLIMPAFALGWYFAAAHMRLTRSSMARLSAPPGNLKFGFSVKVATFISCVEKTTAVASGLIVSNTLFDAVTTRSQPSTRSACAMPTRMA